MLARTALPTLLVAFVVMTAACGGSHAGVDTVEARLPVAFVKAPAKVMRECRRAAQAVGYAVPCPTRIPRRLIGTLTGIPTNIGIRPQRGCQPRFATVGVPPCRSLRSWKGWIAGSSEVRWPREHLTISASPRPIRDYAKFVNGPGWYPGARVDVGGWITVHGRRTRWVFVPPRTNDGSADAGHVMLIWTMDGHTYGIGFHDTSTRAATRAMDLELIRNLRMVR